jgi:hypothetical protein
LENNVRFIAINDGIDTDVGENEIMGFRSVINEFYARDISKKIKSVKKLQAQKGQRLGGRTPYGYLRDPDDKNHLIIDEKIAPYVREMFDLISNGNSLGDVRRYLIANCIPTPSTYNNEDKIERYDWCKSSISCILLNRSYLGHTLAQKHGTVSFKSKKRVIRPESEWVEVKDTHEAITDEQTFEKVQKIVRVNKRKNSADVENVFKGLLKCSTCGAGMCIHVNNRPPHYLCNTNRRQYTASTKMKCTTHHIRYSVLYEFVLNKIKRLAGVAKAHEDDLTEFLKTIRDNHKASDTNREQREIDKLETRIKELDAIIKNLLEQNSLGVISNERFVPLVTGYDAEQKTIVTRVGELKAKQMSDRNNTERVAEFFGLIAKYTDIEELTLSLLHELIYKIVIHERDKKKNEQEIDVHFRFIGLPPENF